MPLHVREDGVTFEPIPEGTHRAVCYGVYDVGSHYDERYQKTIHKVYLCFELPDERMKIKDKDGNEVDKPKAISKKYTLSLNEKANLRKDLASWRGKGFTPEELNGFDLHNILGKCCQLSVVHNVGANKKTYANIQAIISFPKGQKPLKAENELQWFSFEEGAEPNEKTPKWIAEMIQSSVEYGNMKGKDSETGSTEDAFPREEPPPAEEEDVMPF